MAGTARAIFPIAEQVLAWVATRRRYNVAHDELFIPDDDLRRIELTALAAREAAMFHELYGEGEA